MSKPEPSAKVTALGELFRAQMIKLAEWLYKHYQAGINAADPEWYSPVKHGWSGDPFDLDGLAKPFERTQHVEEFDKAVTDTKSPGVTGDLILSQLQGDMLAMFERAYRSRLRTSVRNKIHSLAHAYGQGHETGVIKLGELTYLERLVKAANT